MCGLSLQVACGCFATASVAAGGLAAIGFVIVADGGVGGDHLCTWGQEHVCKIRLHIVPDPCVHYPALTALS